MYLTMYKKVWAKDCQNKNNSYSRNYFRNRYNDVGSGVVYHSYNDTNRVAKDL